MQIRPSILQVHLFILFPVCKTNVLIREQATWT